MAVGPLTFTFPELLDPIATAREGVGFLDGLILLTLLPLPQFHYLHQKEKHWPS